MSTQTLRDLGFAGGKWRSRKTGTSAVDLVDMLVDVVAEHGCAGIYASVLNDVEGTDPNLARDVFSSVLWNGATVPCNCEEGSYCTWHGGTAPAKDTTKCFGYYGCSAISVVKPKDAIPCTIDDSSAEAIVDFSFGSDGGLLAQEEAHDVYTPPLTLPNNEFIFRRRPLDRHELTARLFSARANLQRATAVVEETLHYVLDELPVYEAKKPRATKKRSMKRRTHKTVSKARPRA